MQRLRPPPFELGGPALAHALGRRRRAQVELGAAPRAGTGRCRRRRSAGGPRRAARRSRRARAARTRPALNDASTGRKRDEPVLEPRLLGGGSRPRSASRGPRRPAARRRRRRPGPRPGRAARRASATAHAVLPTPVGPNSAMIRACVDRLTAGADPRARRALLLTGATGGIGQAIARALAGRGAQLILTGRRADVLQPLAAELGGRALAVDLAERAEVARLVGEAGDVDILVANAALPGPGRLDDFSVEEIDRALDVNLRAPIVLAHAPAAGDGGARSRPPRLHLLALRARRDSGHRALQRHQVRPARLRSAVRADLRESGVGVTTVVPGLHPRRRHVRRGRRQAARRRRHEHSGGRRGRRRGRDRAQQRRDRRRALAACVSARCSRASRPRPPAASRVGSARTRSPSQMAAGQRDKR